MRKILLILILFFSSTIFSQEIVVVIKVRAPFYTENTGTTGIIQHYFSFSFSDKNGKLVSSIGEYITRPNPSFNGEIVNEYAFTTDKSNFPLRVDVFGYVKSVVTENGFDKEDNCTYVNNNTGSLVLEGGSNDVDYPYYDCNLNLGTLSTIESSTTGCGDAPTFTARTNQLTATGIFTKGNCNEFSYPKVFDRDTDKFEYRLSSSPTAPWQEFTPTNQLSYFKLSDLNLNDYAGTFQFRIKFESGDTSTIAIFEIIKCSPRLVGSPVTSGATCFDNADGSVKIKFDRAINANEVVRVDLSKSSPDGISLSIERNIYVYPTSATLPNDGKINVNIDSNNEFVINGLARLELPAYYGFKYQSIYNTTTFADLQPTKLPIRFNITSPTKVDFTINPTQDITNIKCYGEATGSIKVNATGGTGTYQYILNGGTPQNSNLFTGLVAGNYSVNVVDSNGCKPDNVNGPAYGAQTVTITQPAAKLDYTNLTSANPSAYNTADGFIKFTIAGGTKNGMSKYKTIEVTETNDITGVTTSYTLNDAYITVNTTSTEISFNGLSGRKTYVFKIVDQNDCFMTVTQSIYAPDKVIVNFNNAQINCFGDITNITATISGGKPDYKKVDWVKYSIANPTVLVTSGSINVPSGSNAVTLNNQGPGVYKFIVTDANDVVSDEFTHTVLQKNEILITGNTAIVQPCFGELVNIPATVTGGTDPKSYQWYQITGGVNNIITGATTETLFNALPGNYKLVVTDANMCQKASPTITIIGTSAINLLGVTNTNILDPGTNTGKITGNISGGNNANGYSYTLTRTLFNNIADNTIVSQSSNASLPLNIASLTSGTYTIAVSTNAPASACTTNKTFTITEPLPFTTTLQKNDIVCNGDTATVSITATGGTPFNNPSEPYTFEWYLNDVSLTQITTGITNTNNIATITGLFAGNYRVFVKDANMVQRIENFSITNVTPITASITETNIVCNGDNTGSITVSASGGSSTTYTYNWLKKDAFGNFITYPGNTNIISNLTVGDYKCMVSNNLNCTPTEVTTSIINLNTPITAILEMYELTSSNSTDGKINVIPTGGAGSYQARIVSPTITAFVPVNGAFEFENLASGTYEIEVKDAANCTKRAFFINVTTLQPLTSNLIKTDVTCFNGTNGTITATILGGRPSYVNLKWYKVVSGIDQDITPSSGNLYQITGLAAGTYKFVANDSNLPFTTTTSSITINQPLDIQLSANVLNQINCFGGNTGRVEIATSGGATAYNVIIKKLPNTTIYNSSTNSLPIVINGLSTGNYEVTRTDNANCGKTITFIITQPSAALSAVVATNGVTNVPIFGQSTGSININVSGGTSPYTFAWSNGSTTEDLMAIPAGTYAVTVTDSKGCMFSLNSIVVTQPVNALTNTITISKPITCNGGTGNLLATPSGGSLSYNYVWSQNGNTLSNTAQLNNVKAGTYNLVVTDTNGASVNQPFTLTQPNPLLATFTITDVSCGNASNGAIIANVTGGTAPYTYTWSNSETAANNQNLSAGFYTLGITDANNCTQFYSNIEVGINGGISINPTITNVSCFGGNNGSIVLAPTINGLPVTNYTVTWIGTTQTGPTRNNLTAGNYKGIITFTSLNCAINIEYNIAQPNVVNLNLGADVNLCDEQNISYNITQTEPGTTYLWTAANGFTSSNSIVTISQTGLYTAKITTPNGCEYTDQVQINKSSMAISAKLLVASQTYTNEEIILINVSDNPNNSTYNWIFPTGAEVKQQTNDLAIVKFTNEGTYKIKLKSKNELGCEDEDESEIFVQNNPNPNSVQSSNNILFKKFMVAPNPLDTSSASFNDLKIMVELANELPLTISFYNLSTGARLLTKNSNPSEVHYFNITAADGINTWASGYYYIVVSTPGSIQAKKLIKQ